MRVVGIQFLNRAWEIVFGVGCAVFTLGCVGASPKVAVIGAGLAGESCAYELVKSGADIVVDVYEARARVGGRVLSVIMEDAYGAHVAELGGQNIGDGGPAEHIKALLAEVGLETYEMCRPWNHVVYYDGASASTPGNSFKKYGFTSESLWDYLEQLQKQTATMEEILQHLCKDDFPLYRLLALQLTSYEGGTPRTLSPFYIGTLHHMLMKLLEEQSRGRVIQVKGGNALLPQELSRRLGSRVHLNKVLRAVERDAQNGFILYFTDGTQATADIVVLAIPCTVYKDILFGERVLPAERLAAIKNVEYGSNTKILVPVVIAQGVCAYANDFLITWKVNMEDPVTMYYRKPHGFFTPDTFAQVLERDLGLVYYSYTPQEDLEAPRMAEDRQFVVYRGIVGQSWPADPYTQGSYSYIGAGQEVVLMAQDTYLGEPMRTLFAPVDNLFFAGEHTSILLDSLGTMEAAVESGLRMARAILKSLSE